MYRVFLVLAIVFFGGCGPKDVSNTIHGYATSSDANDADLTGFGYKNGKYLGLDVGGLRLKTPRLGRKVDANGVSVYYSKPPKRCKAIGYITLENSKELPDGSLGGFTLGESAAAKFEKKLKKAASLAGVDAVGYFNEGDPEIRMKKGYVIGNYGGYIMVFDRKEHRLLRFSAKAYDCGR